MIVSLQLFAASRELIGAERIQIELPDQATIADVKRMVAQMYPQAAALLSRSLVARNQDYVLDTDTVAPADELAVIPPVSGG
jgi:molybdopterin converting factor subunit 1